MLVAVNPEIELVSPLRETVPMANSEVVIVTPVKEFAPLTVHCASELSEADTVPPAIELLLLERVILIAASFDVVTIRFPTEL